MSKIGARISAEVQRIAAESPDYRYEPPDGDQCVYIHDGEPSCIFGHALLNLGLIDASLEHAKAVRRYTTVENLVNTDDIESVLLDYLGLSIDDDEVGLFLAIQEQQDNAKPWGKAVS